MDDDRPDEKIDTWTRAPLALPVALVDPSPFGRKAIRMNDPLAGLDEIAWGKLETVDGHAADAPRVLRGLASGDAKKCQSSMGWLSREVLHQSTPAPCAAQFVPFLLALAELPKQPARAALLALLGDLACAGDHVSFLDTGFATTDAGVAQLHARVAAGAAAFVSMLDDRAAKVRAAAAFVLAWLPEHADRSLAALRTRLGKEKDATARASLLLALSVLAPGADASLFATELSAADAVVRGAALAALARLGPLDEKARAATFELATAGTIDGLCWYRGQLGSLVLSSVIRAARRDGDAELLISLVFSPMGHVVLGAAATQLFPTNVDATKLAPAQRAFLDRLTADPPMYGLIGAFWKQRGLPVLATAAREVLGLERVKTRMDVELAVEGVTARFADHLTRADANPASRKPLAHALSQGRTAREVFDFCADSLALGLRGRDPDGGWAWGRAIADLLDGCGDDLVDTLRDVNIYRPVQWPEGGVGTTHAIALPMLIVLARRAPTEPVERLRGLLSCVSLTRAFDVEWNGPLVAEALRALDVERRSQLVTWLPLNEGYHRTFTMPLVLETPHADVASRLVRSVSEMRDRYAYGRNQPYSPYSDGYPPAALKKLAPRDHPLAQEQTGPIRQYVPILREAGLAAAADELHAAVEGFLGM